MKYIFYILIILLILGYIFYQRALSFFKALIVNYQISVIEINNVNKLILSISVFNPNTAKIVITNPVITILDGNNNLLVRLELLSENKKIKLVQGENIYDFKVTNKLIFSNGINLQNIKTFFSAKIYGLSFSKEIPTRLQ